MLRYGDILKVSGNSFPFRAHGFHEFLIKHSPSRGWKSTFRKRISPSRDMSSILYQRFLFSDFSWKLMFPFFSIQHVVSEECSHICASPSENGEQSCKQFI